MRSAPRSAAEPISRRALNRALLERQLLLRRASMPIAEAAEHLVGLQAQAAMPPYVALWSRLEGFDAHELGRLLTEREVVRLTLMRGTIHLVTARDALRLRPLVQVVAERGHQSAFGRRMGGVDPAELAAAVREELAGGPLAPRELARRLVAREIGDDIEAITNATRAYVPLVQLPPRGVWGAGGQVRYLPLETWTGRELEREPSLDDVVLRYLRAFGPASAQDAQTWCGLTRLGEVLERLRPRLVAFRDEDGRELFDVPDAPRPDPDVPAPVRFLGEFDNALLSHADRSRIVPGGPAMWMQADGRSVGSVLVDGMLRATWWRDGATIAVRPTEALTTGERDAVEVEAHALARFLAPANERHEVRFA
jgi:Winged helix DNA-binding domain